MIMERIIKFTGQFLKLGSHTDKVDVKPSINLNNIKDITTLTKLEIEKLKTRLKDFGVLVIPSHLNAASIDTTAKKTYLFSPLWHIDFSYRNCPPHLSVIQMVKKSPRCWETSFVSLTEIYKQISTEIKSSWKNLKVMYSKTNCIHPLLWIHPFTGKPLVFFDFRFVSDIFDMCKFTGKVILENMNDVILNLGTLFGKVKPIYKHNWQLGDIVIIDNYAV